MAEHRPAPPFAHTSGPRPCKLLLLGEAWGESEDMVKLPFAGESGKLLWDMLGEAMPGESPELHREASAMHRYGLAWVRKRDAWLAASGIAMTNVLAFRPPGNKMEALCEDKKTSGQGYPYSAAVKGKYLREEYFGELTRLRAEIEGFQPNLILALGNTALWSLLNATNIGSIRGAITETMPGAPVGLAQQRKCLATYHPAGVLRSWSWRPIVVADLMKAAREAHFPEVRRPARRIMINSTLAELELFVQLMTITPPPWLSVDIETGGGLIKCIGFADSRERAVVVNFIHPTTWASYWLTPGEELRAWQLVKALLESPIVKLGQNFLYDLQYILKLGIRPRNCTEDTMLLHHSHFPEMQKGLGFLNSIYTNEFAYKLMNRPRADTEKRDE